VCVWEREKHSERGGRGGNKRDAWTTETILVCVWMGRMGVMRERKMTRDNRVYSTNLKQFKFVTVRQTENTYYLVLIQIFEYGRAKETGSTTKQGDGVP